jgi:DNA-binding NarL/FixJ family response regulator
MNICPSDPLKNGHKKVLVIQSDRILGGVLLSLISHRENLDVVSLSISNPIDLISEASRILPDVIILDDQGHFACHADLHELLEISPEIKIIILNSNSNHVQVISKNEIDVNHAEDFFEML